MRLKWYGIAFLITANLVFFFFNYSEFIKHLVTIYSVTFTIIGIILIIIDCHEDNVSHIKRLKEKILNVHPKT